MTEYNWANYTKQRHFCVNLLCKTKKDHFPNLNIRDLPDNRKFWKTVKLYFSNKGLNSNQFLLKEKRNLVSNEKQLATIMNSFFIYITKGLELKEGNETNGNTMEDVLDVSNSHPSTKRIRRTVKTYEKFSFQPVPKDLLREIILKLDGFKATPVGDISVDMLNLIIDIHLPF